MFFGDIGITKILVNECANLIDGSSKAIDFEVDRRGKRVQMLGCLSAVFRTSAGNSDVLGRTVGCNKLQSNFKVGGHLQQAAVDDGHVQERLVQRSRIFTAEVELEERHGSDGIVVGRFRSFGDSTR